MERARNYDRTGWESNDKCKNSKSLIYLKFKIEWIDVKF